VNRKSYLIAAAIAAILVIWMLSGLWGGQKVATPNAITPVAERDGMAVEVQTFSAERIDRFLENQGQTRAEHDIELRAETAGRVAEVQVAEGDEVAEGDLILRLAQGDRVSQQAEAEAKVAQRKADFLAIERLENDGFQSEIALNEAQAALATARAQLDAINKEIADTQIVAPIDGRIESRPAEVGDYVSVGDAVARIIDSDPLIVVANVAQQDIRKVNLGREAQITLATGDTLVGEVRYISEAADAGSRTFRVEAAAPNPDGLPVGMSATVRIPLDSAQAHFLSPAWLSLEDTGQVGVKAVDANDEVVFYPVDIVRAERDGVWVTGLPDALRLITVGQGFVREGEPVTPVLNTD
jgi:multidrug efflux system membrane fusion protein